MSDTQGNPGTPEPEKTAEAPKGASESPGSEGREAAPQDEQQDRTDWKGMALGLKATLEERNRREEQQQAQAAPMSPTADPRMAAAQAEMVRLQQAYASAAQDASSGDERAFLLLKLIEDQMQSKTELMHQMQLGRIADPERRNKVWDYFQKNRDKVTSVDAAEAVVDGLEYRARRDELDRKQKEAEAVLKARSAGATGTGGSREVTVSEAKARNMTEAQFDNEVDRLRAEGKHAEARRLMGLVQDRKIILTG